MFSQNAMLVTMEAQAPLVLFVLEAWSNRPRVTRRPVILNAIQHGVNQMQNVQHVVRINILAHVVSSTNLNSVRIGFSPIVNLFPCKCKETCENRS